MRYQAAPRPGARLRERGNLTGIRRPSPNGLRASARRSGLLSLLSYLDADLDWRPRETERLSQPPLDVPAVASLEKAAGEHDELRWPSGWLRREEDLGLLATAYGWRSGGHELAQEGVESRRRHAGVPGMKSRL